MGIAVFTNLMRAWGNFFVRVDGREVICGRQCHYKYSNHRITGMAHDGAGGRQSPGSQGGSGTLSSRNSGDCKNPEMSQMVLTAIGRIHTEKDKMKTLNPSVKEQVENQEDFEAGLDGASHYLCCRVDMAEAQS